jgi:hypothetical protein
VIGSGRGLLGGTIFMQLVNSLQFFAMVDRNCVMGMINFAVTLYYTGVENY